MAERPILFSGPMVRAILDGSKTQTRRVVKRDVLDAPGRGLCPYGVPGDRLWVRETWQAIHVETPTMDGDYDVYEAPKIPKNNEDGWWSVIYAATDPDGDRPIDDRLPWRPSIHMPRWASRITLEVTGVRVERLRAIRAKDMRAEGVTCGLDYPGFTHCTAMPCLSLRTRWVNLWDSLNADRGYPWKSNPWVWVVEFRRLTPADGNESAT